MVIIWPGLDVVFGSIELYGVATGSACCFDEFETCLESCGDDLSREEEDRKICFADCLPASRATDAAIVVDLGAARRNRICCARPSWINWESEVVGERLSTYSDREVVESSSMMLTAPADPPINERPRSDPLRQNLYKPGDSLAGSFRFKFESQYSFLVVKAMAPVRPSPDELDRRKVSLSTHQFGRPLTEFPACPSQRRNCREHHLHRISWPLSRRRQFLVVTEVCQSMPESSSMTELRL